jgi:CelD/BcsL family acetyltransferase involved in cellulose biosynthesis
MPYSFAFGRQGGRDMGAALLVHARLDVGPLNVPALFLGTAGEGRHESTYVQYNRLLAADDEVASFTEALLAGVLPLKWSVLRLNGFVPDHAAALTAAARRLGMSVECEVNPSPTCDFQKLDPGKDVLASLSHDTRSKMRRSLRILAEKLGPLTTEWAETRDQAQEIVDELIVLHTQQWRERGEPGALHTARQQEYHRQLVDVLFPEHLIAFRVRQGTTTIGCLLNLVEGGHITNHRSGIRFFTDDNRLKPGYVTDLLFMEGARRRGYAEYDLLVGHDYYKRLITNAEHTLVWARAGRGARARAFAIARRLYWHDRTRPVLRAIERVVTRAS